MASHSLVKLGQHVKKSLQGAFQVEHWAKLCMLYVKSDQHEVTKNTHVLEFREKQGN